MGRRHRQCSSGLCRGSTVGAVSTTQILLCGLLVVTATATGSVFVGVGTAGAGGTLTITTAALPAGTVGGLYSQMIGVSGGTTPYGFAVTAGSLPGGLTMNVATGAITGSPTSAGSSTVTVTVTDAASQTASQPLSITVLPGTPTAVTAGGGVDSANVTWMAGEVDQTYWITPTDLTTATTLSPLSAGSATDLTVNGLAVGDAYTFTVSGYLGELSSSPSAPSNTVVPTATPALDSVSGSTSASLGPPGTIDSISATSSGGTGSLTVARYASDPLTSTVPGGVYYDVRIAPQSAYASVVVTLCGVPRGATVKWWNPLTASYQSVSSQASSQIAYANGCVTITFGATTTPTIGALYGTVLAVPGSLAPGSALGQGYWEVASDGGVFSFGSAQFFGSMGGKLLNQPIVGLVHDSDNSGYDEVGSDGGVFAFGDAGFYGSMSRRPLNQPIVGMDTTSDGGGYWLVARDGGVFAFGDAGFYGSMSGRPLNQPIVGMDTTSDGGGYWLVARDGGVFAFGDAGFYGSMSGRPLNQPIVGMDTTSDAGGYWLVARDGGVFAFGDAGFDGSMADKPLDATMVALALPDAGRGYWLARSDGGVFSFGAAAYLGSMAEEPLNAPIVGLVSVG